MSRNALVAAISLLALALSGATARHLLEDPDAQPAPAPRPPRKQGLVAGPAKFAFTPKMVPVYAALQSYGPLKDALIACVEYTGARQVAELFDSVAPAVESFAVDEYCSIGSLEGEHARMETMLMFTASKHLQWALSEANTCADFDVVPDACDIFTPLRAALDAYAATRGAAGATGLCVGGADSDAQREVALARLPDGFQMPANPPLACAPAASGP